MIATEDPSPLLEPGTPIGDWIVEQPLGGSGRYRCHRRDTPFRKAVLRVVRAADAARARQEAEALARLQHPNIQGVLGLEASGDDLYLVTEAVEGVTLDGFVRQPPLGLGAAIDVAVQVADALAVAHARGLVHGDVRPANVLLTPDGRARLVGFDLRSSLDRAPADAAYAAPEGGPPTPRHDAYAFGVLLYELLTGERVAPGERRAALSFDVPMPVALREVLARLTHPDPALRCRVGTAHDALLLARRESLGDSGAESTFVDGDRSESGAHAPGVIGRYRVVREVGRGGVGVVYEAEDPDLRRRVALKVLLAGTFARARDVARFKKEAQAVARLHHPGVVEILDVGHQLEAAWFAMEYVDGPTLLEEIRRQGRLPWPEAVRIAAEVARALEHAHEAGIVHRDVKPNNVLLAGGRRAKLTDFGLALEDGARDATRLTRSGQVLGTPMYMSPEQAAGDLAQVGPRSDVYALGVTLYEALTGKVPFEGATALQVVANVLAGQPRSPREHAPELPRAVELVTLRAMRREPRDRYPSAGAFAEDLERLLRGEPPAAAAPTFGDRTRWFVRRNRPALLVGGLVTATVLVALGATLLVARGRARAAEEAREHAASVALDSVVRRVEAATAEGRPEEAEAAWAAFAGRPEHRGTRALVRGWLARAERLAALGEGEGRLSALASAYAAAERGEDQAEALRALARGQREELRLDVLPMVLETLRERHPAAARDREILRLERDARAAHRDLAGAAAQGEDDPVARVLRALAAATRTDRVATVAQPWPGGGWLLRHHDADPDLVRAEPTLPVERALHLPVPIQPGRLFAVPAPTPALLGTAVGGGAAVLAVEPDRVRFVRAWEGGIGHAVSGDLDGDGVVETYAAGDRALWRFAPDGAGDWTREAPAATLQAANSSVYDLDLGDLDADGVRELVVATGEWGAYDVRVLEPDHDGLALAARRKLGTVAQAAVLRGPDGRDRVLAAKHDVYPNLRVFPAESPLGEPEGLWLLAHGEGGLDGARVRPWSCGWLGAGDLDGDGLDDAVAGCRGDLAILVQRPDGGFDDVWLRRLSPLALAELDGDPARELLVADPDDGHRVWVLGAGSEAPPVLPRVERTAAAPPRDADPGFTAAWQRAEDLVYAGQREEAARALRELADLRWGQPSGRAALLRAADLHDERRAWLEAAELYLLAAQQGAEAEALPAAARAFASAADPERELEVLRRLQRRGPLEGDLAARRAALEPVAHLPAIDLGFGEPLDPRWDVRDPLAVRRDRGAGTLRVEAMGERVLARLPVRWDGGWLRVELEAVVERTEWGAGFGVGLVPRGASAPLRGAWIEAWGGGELVQRRALCTGRLEHPIRHPELPVKVVAWVHPDGTSTCALEEDGRPAGRLAVPDRAEPPAADEGWDLAIVAIGPPSALAVADLRRIRVLGAAIEGEPPSGPDAAARRALADGNPAQALSLLPADPDPALALALAADRFDHAALVRALSGPGSAEIARATAHLAHARLAEHGEALREALGPAWPATFATAWETTLFTQSMSDPVVRGAVLGALPGIEAQPPRDDDERAALVLLNALRGAAATAAGDDALAAASLLRAEALWEPLAAGEGERVEALRARIVGVRVDRAALAARAGDLGGAFALLEDALARAPAPAVAADAVAARSDLGALRADPRWDAVVERVRRGR